MIPDPVTTPSLLPAMVFLVPLVGGALALLGRRWGPALWTGTALLSSGAVAVVALAMAAAAVRGEVLVGWNNELRVDGLSALLVAVIGVVGLLATVYSAGHARGGGVLDHGTGTSMPGRGALFHALLQWFLATMAWGCVTNNIVMLYVAVEATTLTSGLLVAFFWDRRALEAGYKYLMILTIAITFALFGGVLTYAAAAATGRLAHGDALLISEVRGVAALIPSGTALVAVAFLVVGFGAKAGIAPFHPWLPDAHAEAPTPISVLLSGVMIKMALYALARTVSIFYPTWPQLTVFAVALGAFTMLFGIVLALVQDDLKRLLAYSSVSQMGYVLAGVGLGTYLGCYGGLFHLLNHALAKSLLFMAAGAVIYATGARRLSQLGGLARQMPLTSACFFIGALTIGGLPPLAGFMSKLTVYLALARSGMWWAGGVAVVAGLLTLVVLARTAAAVFWASPPAASGATLEAHEVPPAMWGPMVVLATACALLGVAPQLPFGLLDRAATVLATLGR